KSFPPARQHFLDDRRQRAPFSLHLSRECLHANGIHDFKRSEFPAKAPAQRAINVHNVVGNLRDTPRRIQTRFGKPAPQELLRFVTLLPFQHRPDKRAQPLAGVLDRLTHFERTEFRLLPRATLHSVHIERQDLLLALALNLFVQTLPRLVTEPSSLGHLFHQRRQLLHFPPPPRPCPVAGRKTRSTTRPPPSKS